MSFSRTNPAKRPVATVGRLIAAAALLLLPAAGECGAVWLQSGRILSGRVTSAGQTVIVETDHRREIIPKSHVLASGDSVDAIYRTIASRTSGHLKHRRLAEWCLDNGLQQRAVEQLKLCRASDPQVVELTARAATQTELPDVTPPPAESRRPAYSLSRDTLRTYRNKVAPLLRNGCGTAGCHSPVTSRPLFVSSAARPDDVRAMIGEVLRRVDPLTPANSPLVTMALTEHGGSDGPPLNGRLSVKQAETLATWASAAAIEMRPDRR